MDFIQPDLAAFLPCLNKLRADAKPLWGKMTAQHMVEHLTDVVRIGSDPHDSPLAVPEEQVEAMQAFLYSDEPIAKNIPNPAVREDYVCRNADLPQAIEELSEAWTAYEAYYQANPTAKVLHPMFGDLDKKGWDRMHAKHFTHHFTQFGVR